MALQFTMRDASRFHHQVFLGALAALGVYEEVASLYAAIRIGLCVFVASFAHLYLGERHHDHGVALWTIERQQTKICLLLFFSFGLLKDFRRF
jgi:hypothetical protein